MRTQPFLFFFLCMLGVLVTSTLIGQTVSDQTEQHPPASDITVNVNTADAESLAEALDGVGLSRARSIIEWREANGNFEDPYDLVQVRGISERIVKLNEQRIRVSDTPREQDG